MVHSKIKELKTRANPVNYSNPGSQSNELQIDDRRVKAYLAVWGIPDDHGTVFVKGCCSKSIQERGPKSNAKYKIACLFMHDQGNPMGVFDVLEEDEYGLYAEVPFDQVDGGDEIDRVLGQVRSGTLNQFSIGFNYIWDKVEYNEKTNTFNLKEIDLYEGSVCTIASNQETYAIRSGRTEEDEREALVEETESLLRTLPRQKQLEMRQLITRHISLAKLEPPEKKLEALRQTKPIPLGEKLFGELLKDLKTKQQ